MSGWDHSARLREKFNRWNHKQIAERNMYTATFNIESWNQLTPDKQIQHTFQEYKLCQHIYTKIQSYFPVKSKRFIGIKKETNRDVTHEDVITVTIPNQPTTKTILQDTGKTAKALYDQVNPLFQTVMAILLSKP